MTPIPALHSGKKILLNGDVTTRQLKAVLNGCGLKLVASKKFGLVILPVTKERK